MKKFLLTLMLTIGVCCSFAMAQTASFTQTSFTKIEDGKWSATVNGVTIEVSNDYNQSQKTDGMSYDPMRWYKDAVITITSTQNINGITFTAGSNNYATALAKGTVTPGTLTANASTVTWANNTSNAVTEITINNSNGQTRISSIDVTYSDPTAVSIAKPQFSVASGIVDAGTSVSLSCTTPNVDFYYATEAELNKTNPTAAEVKGAEHKGATFTVNDTNTYYAVATDNNGNFSPVAVATYAVPTHAGTAEDPYNVADAIAVATAVGDNATEDTYYIQGYVVKAEYSTQYKNATWKIADTAGATENLFTVFRCKDVNGAELEDENKVVVGDKIVVKGNIFNYNNNTPEAKNAELVSVTGLQPAGLSWSVETFSYDKANPSDLPTLTNTNNVAVTYSSSDQTVATIDKDGVVTVLEVGTTTIKAAFAGNNEYKANTASYVLTVVDSNNFEDITDTLDENNVAQGYDEKTIECTESGITYVLYATKNSGIQFNNGSDKASQTCGVVVTVNQNGYVLSSVKFNFGSTVSSEELVLYGKETAYAGTPEVGGSTPGTVIETFTATKKGSHTVTPSKEWQYVGFYPGGKNIQFSSIEFTWTLSSGLPQSDTFTFHNENLTTEHGVNHVALDGEGNWAANAIELTDDSGLDMPEGVEISTPSAKYTRDFPHNGWQSICLPFSGNASDFVDGDHKIAELTGVTYDETEDAYTLEWTTVSTIVAHKAYIIKPVADGEQHVGHNTSTTTISGYNQHAGTEANGYTFKMVGTYKNIAFGSYSPDQRALMYVMNQGNFYHPGAGATLKPFRAYLVMEPASATPSSAQMPAMLRMSVNGEEPGTTGINDIEIDLNLGVANADNCYYDLLGRKVENPAAGVYIQNGKKVYIK